jgi:hypothetical protein
MFLKAGPCGCHLLRGLPREPNETFSPASLAAHWARPSGCRGRKLGGRTFGRAQRPFILKHVPCQFEAQSKRLDTLSSLAIRAIASPIKGAIETTLILLETRTASVAWIVSVMTISLSWEAAMRATAPPERTP